MFWCLFWKFDYSIVCLGLDINHHVAIIVWMFSIKYTNACVNRNRCDIKYYKFEIQIHFELCLKLWIIIYFLKFQLSLINHHLDGMMHLVDFFWAGNGLPNLYLRFLCCFEIYYLMWILYLVSNYLMPFYSTFLILSLIFQNFLFVVDIFISIHIVDLWYNPFKTQSNRVLISINHITNISIFNLKFWTNWTFAKFERQTVFEGQNLSGIVYLKYSNLFCLS